MLSAPKRVKTSQGSSSAATASVSSSAGTASGQSSGSGSGSAAAAAGGTQGKPASYAQAVTNNKRNTLSPLTAPRPTLVRGKPVLQHDQYLSMERPAPPVRSPYHVYADYRASSLPVDEIMEKALPLLQPNLVGCEHFAAQQTLAFILSSQQARDALIGKVIPDTSITLYGAPSEAAILRKYTLQGCPTHDPDQLATLLKSAFQDLGHELVLLVPMMYEKLQCRSTTWHATVRVPNDDVADPPSVFRMMDVDIVCDIPGRRRYCKHCESTVHTKVSCRQGQRLRAKARSLQQAQRNLDASLARETASDSDGDTLADDHTDTDMTTNDNTTDDTTMEYVASYQQHALNLANTTPPGTTTPTSNGTLNGSTGFTAVRNEDVRDTFNE